MGIVIDEELAKRAVCHGYKTDGEFVWSAGVIGALSEKQKKELCPDIILKEKEVPPALKERWRKFSEAAKTCSLRVREKYPKGERLLPYLECMGEEAEKRGIKLGD